MSGEIDLNKLRTLEASLRDGVYVFATVADDGVPAGVSPE